MIRKVTDLNKIAHKSKRKPVSKRRLQYLLHKAEVSSHQYKAERDTLIDDIAVVRANNKRLEEELKTRREETDNLEAKLSAQLSMKRDLEKENKHLKERINKAEELIEGNIETLKTYGGIMSKNYELEQENKALRLQADTYFDEWQNAMSENESQQSVIEQFKHDLQYTEWEVVPALKRQNEQQAALLKEFSKFINYKLIVSPASDTYKHYRSELDKLGVK